MVYIRIFALILAASLLTGPGALALDPDEMFDDPKLEERAREIGRQLRCMVCQNQSIFDSNAGLAKDLRVLVRERMTAGDTDKEVVDYVAARYGSYVRLKPPVNSHTYVLWIAPVLILLIGAAMVAFYLRGRNSATAMSATERETAQKILRGEPQ